MAFDEVIIRLKKLNSYDEPHVFQVQVVRSPVPLNGGAFRLDVDAELLQFRKKFAQMVDIHRRFYQYKAPEKNRSQIIDRMARQMEELGDNLYHLLPASFREGFPRLIQHSLAKERGIRLIIEAGVKDQADRLLSLPWELTFAQERHAYLARTPRLLIVRRLLDAVNQKSRHKWPEYHVLHLIADDPNDKQREEFQKLAQMEQQVISEAISPERYTLVTNPGSVEQLQSQLSGQQILHFLGHGDAFPVDEGSVPREDTQRGYLRFIKAGGERQHVTGEQLQHLLAETSTVQLVVLNACHGGSTAAGNLALELIYSGLPVVVAMQAKIHPQAAESFTQAFYGALQEGHDFDVAVARGRAKMATQFPSASDWCLPVLYTNVGVSDQISADEPLWQWFSQLAQRVIPRASLALGAFLLVVGLLLLLSGAAPALPDVLFLVRTTTWLIALPPLVAFAVYLSGPLPIPSTWTLSHRAALAIRLLATASVALGFSLFYFLWLGLTLLLSLGFWAILSPIAQFLLLVPAFALSVLVSYAQSMGFRRAFISDANIEAPEIEWGDLVVALAGYLIMFMPLAVWVIWPSLLAPPWGTLLAGGFLLAFGLATRPQR